MLKFEVNLIIRCSICSKYFWNGVALGISRTRGRKIHRGDVGTTDKLWLGASDVPEGLQKKYHVAKFSSQRCSIIVYLDFSQIQNRFFFFWLENSIVSSLLSHKTLCFSRNCNLFLFHSDFESFVYETRADCHANFLQQFISYIKVPFTLIFKHPSRY